MRSRAP